MHRLTRLLILASFLITWIGCSMPEPEQTATEPLITVCVSGPCTTTAQPPATSTYMWQPSLRIWPVEGIMRFCDLRIPPQAGEVAIYDLPFVNGAPAPTAQCAVIKDTQNGVPTGGWFDWLAFQDYGWATPTASIRALQLGPGTKAIFSDKPLDTSRPDGCAVPSTCIGVGGNPTIVTNVADVRTIFPGFPTFNMASLHIERM